MQSADPNNIRPNDVDSNRFLTTENGSHLTNINSLANLNSLSNYNTFNYPVNQVRQRLNLNCITTNYNNGPISSSYINQPIIENNKYNTFSQPFVNSMKPNVIKNSNNSSVQSQFYIANSSANSPTTNMAGKGPQALFLTSKDGQQTTMVVQQQPNSVSVTDCNVTTAVLNNSSINQNSGVATNPQQQIALVSNTSGVLPNNMVLNMNPSRSVGPTFVNPVNNQGQRTLGPRVLINNSIRLAPQMLQRSTTPNVLGQNLSLPNYRGTILLKTDNGQLQIVNVGGLPTSTQNVLPQTFRYSVPVSTTAATTVQPQTSNIRQLTQQIVTIPASMATNLQRTTLITHQTQQNQPHRLTNPQQLNQPLTIQTATVNSQPANSAPAQMSPNTAKKKCKNFLSTLIKLASDQPEVATNVKNLIQGLIDGNIQPEDFTVQLQSELNSSPQPCLVPFLKKSLPYLRHSLMLREMIIEGVRAPPQGSIQTPIQQIQFQGRTPIGGATVRILSSNVGNNQNSATIITPVRAPAKTIQKVQKHSTLTVIPTGASSLNSSIKSNVSSAKKKDYVSKSKTPPTSKDRKEKKSKEDKESFSSSLRDDDDINDVAAMGGVNLMEEHQRILATNAEFVGAQIRSCKDDPFLSVHSLQERLSKIATSYGLEEVSTDVVALVSHAAQERLKTLVEKLGIIAEHRMENLKMDSRYEITQDVRSQIKFLDELDKLEKKRHLEQERELLMKAAKSRSKAEDPEQLKLKQKAKEMQRAELEEARQREANETALLAIGPRKKIKTTHALQNSSLVFNNSSNSMSLSLLNFNPNKQQIRRLKRVNLRDLQFLMEQEKGSVRTPMLYKAYAK